MQQACLRARVSLNKTSSSSAVTVKYVRLQTGGCVRAIESSISIIRAATQSPLVLQLVVL
jgi:hypothetical protein